MSDLRRQEKGTKWQQGRVQTDQEECIQTALGTNQMPTNHASKMKMGMKKKTFPNPYKVSKDK